MGFGKGSFCGYGVFPGVSNHPMSPQTQFPPNSMEYRIQSVPSHISPMFMPSSPPPTVVQDSPINCTFSNYQFNRESPAYPSVVVNGLIVDLNDIVRDIIINKPSAPFIENETESISLICPLSQVPITCPGRGALCRHRQCFDLKEFIITQTTDVWLCPICRGPVDLQTLRFDPLFFSNANGAKAAIPIKTEQWDTDTLFSNEFMDF